MRSRNRRFVEVATWIFFATFLVSGAVTVYKMRRDTKRPNDPVYPRYSLNNEEFVYEWQRLASLRKGQETAYVEKQISDRNYLQERNAVEKLEDLAAEKRVQSLLKEFESALVSKHDGDRQRNCYGIGNINNILASKPGKITIYTFGAASNNTTNAAIISWSACDTSGEVSRITYSYEILSSEREVSVYSEGCSALVLNSVLNSSASDESTTAWMNFGFERLSLNYDFVQAKLTRDEYEREKKLLLDREDEWARQPVSAEEMRDYYAQRKELLTRAETLEKELAQTREQNKALVEELRRKEALEQAKSNNIPLSTLLISLIAAIGTLSGIMIQWRMDSRQVREMKWKELQAKETGLRISQLEQMKDLQVAELKLKIADLEKKASVITRPDKW